MVLGLYRLSEKDVNYPTRQALILNASKNRESLQNNKGKTRSLDVVDETRVLLYCPQAISPDFQTSPPPSR
ncbi:unnamed protein product [Dovyalis caffra]|uniref:Uncharacterized protein n=1 Tax=Dovyalis caffra TaxID=77055 RepID=A0AAV1R033_9ROSI|nr:unnamed protein product [Dovyalis caffra]